MFDCFLSKNRKNEGRIKYFAESISAIELRKGRFSIESGENNLRTNSRLQGYHFENGTGIHQCDSSRRRRQSGERFENVACKLNGFDSS